MTNILKNRNHSYFLIESHPVSLGKNVEVKLNIKHKAAQPLTKVLEKEFKLADGKQDFLITIYSGEIISSFLKDKEINSVNNIRAFIIKLVLKENKNKFELIINPYIDCDSFFPFVKFESMKKLIGKPVEPPPQINLTPFNYISVFNEALSISLKKQANDPTVLDFLRFCRATLKTFSKIPFKLFLLIYLKILNSQNLELISSMLDMFSINKIEQPKSQAEIIMHKETMKMIFKNQKIFLDIIKNIDSSRFFLNITKFYTIIIFYFFTLNDTKTIEDIILDLRDKNIYDKYILSKIFLTDVTNFYRNLPINKQIKMSLIDGYLEVSQSYQNLQTAFSLISEYFQGNLNQTLSILVKYYDKIHQICFQLNDVLKIDDYIKPCITDNINQIQENLNELGEKQIKYGYRAISIQIKTWSRYLNYGGEKNFLDFLSSYLIKISLNYLDIKEALDYIIKYNKKDVGKMMNLFVQNYDKLEAICKNENKNINAGEYLEPKVNDNKDVIKENLDFIFSKKFSSNFETIIFPIKIWLYYVRQPNFDKEFLLYIENKLLENASNYDDIIDCLTYSSSFRDKKIVEVLRFVINNFEIINSFSKLNDKQIDFSKYFKSVANIDNVEEIYELICQLIQLEINKNYKTFDFPINMWEPYSKSKDLKHLRTIRKIIIKLKEIDKNLDEESIELPRKIHDIGYIYIAQGKLKDNQLIEFLGKEEAFYKDKLIDNFIEIGNTNQNQIDAGLAKINNLVEEYNILSGRTDFCDKELHNISTENNNIVKNVNNLLDNIDNLLKRLNECESDLRILRARFTK